MGFLRTLGWAPLVVAAALSLGSGARANDTSAALGTGGLLFVQNDVVSMLSEDLFVSEKEIRVRYVFRNTSAEDVRTIVAFPMPDLVYSEQEIAIPNPDAANFLDFQTQVDGAPVETQIEQRVFALGIERTGLLKALNIPLAPIQRATLDALDKLPADKQQQLFELGLVRRDDYDAGKGMERHLAPLNWTLKTVYFWTQTFPKGRDLVVEHRYRPSVGVSVGTLLGMPTKEPFLVRELKRMDETFCIDSAFKATVARAPRIKGSESPAFSEARIDYVLKTGSNWFGPIADFTLTIDKGAPANLISFCGSGVKKIGPTTFQMHATDFYPERDLNILILKPAPRE
ncbi:DUF4424 domain-containing protein [Aquabacter spiritensis]|uniref:Uncharacterized protein DUF4424 n=1 Tax=Aquabacter spiritensis TaxID=933073 RepID=A0A4R3LS19_9HYPH|nr:DUF4424 domain-containing protein [Aquabacter spiritensis]TCT00967.1 uncharacterized protein DUF4424 [Aquabacter spiritensis]